MLSFTFCCLADQSAEVVLCVLPSVRVRHSPNRVGLQYHYLHGGKARTPNHTPSHPMIYCCCCRVLTVSITSRHSIPFHFIGSAWVASRGANHRRVKDPSKQGCGEIHDTHQHAQRSVISTKTPRRIISTREFSHENSVDE